MPMFTPQMKDFCFEIQIEENYHLKLISETFVVEDVRVKPTKVNYLLCELLFTQLLSSPQVGFHLSVLWSLFLTLNV